MLEASLAVATLALFVGILSLALPLALLYDSFWREIEAGLLHWKQYEGWEVGDR